MLARLEETSEAYEAGARVVSSDEPSDRLFVVRSGWFYSHRTFADGRRQVLRFHCPGDLVGLEEIPYKVRNCEVDAATQGVLCPLPKDCLDEIFSRSPRLTALLWSVAMMDQGVFLDRLRVLGRMSAVERLAHLLLEFHTRLRLTGAVADDQSFEVPLTQDVLGDAVGLTNVYVSRTLKMMETLGLLERSGRKVRLLNVEQLVEISDFRSRLEPIDVGWFPQAGH